MGRGEGDIREETQGKKKEEKHMGGKRKRQIGIDRSEETERRDGGKRLRGESEEKRQRERDRGEKTERKRQRGRDRGRETEGRDIGGET